MSILSTIWDALLNIHFMRPFYLFLLIAVFWLGKRLYTKPLNRTPWRYIIDPQLQGYLFPRNASPKSPSNNPASAYKNNPRGFVDRFIKFFTKEHLGKILSILTITWLILAVMIISGISFSRQMNSGMLNSHTNIIVLDTSWSMNGIDVQPTRLQRAKFKIQDFLDMSKGESNALIAYTDEPFLVVPPTKDKFTILNLLQDLSPTIMPSSSKKGDLQKALAMALNLAKRSKTSQNSILVITNKINNSQINPIISTWKSQKALQRENNINISILTIGKKDSFISDEKGALKRNRKGTLMIANYSEGQVKSLAQQISAQWQPFSSSDNDIKNILSFFSYKSSKWIEEKNIFDEWIDSGVYLIPILILLLLLLLHFRSPIFFSIVFYFFILDSLSLNPKAQAQQVKEIQTKKDMGSNLYTSSRSLSQWLLSWWLSDDQRGLIAYKNKNFAEAKNTFNSRKWKAVSAFSDKDFPLSQRIWQNDKSIEGQYNFALSLAHQSYFNKALEAFEQIINNPMVNTQIQAKAQHNYDLIRAYLDTPQKSQQTNRPDNQHDKAPTPNKQSSDNSNKTQQEQKQERKEDKTATPKSSPKLHNSLNQNKDDAQRQEQKNNSRNDKNNQLISNFQEQQLSNSKTNASLLLKRKFKLEYNRRQVKKLQAKRKKKNYQEQ